VQLLGQCSLEGSLIDPLKSSSSEDREIKNNKRWVRYIEEPMRARKRLARSIYLIGVASNQPLPKGPANLLTTAPGRQPRSQAILQAQSTRAGHDSRCRAAASDARGSRGATARAERDSFGSRQVSPGAPDGHRAARGKRSRAAQRTGQGRTRRGGLAGQSRSRESRYRGDAV
jgi:hypothetical protein